ncbi:ribonuclease H-like domain-containing protein, partial [Tanacetum coccineum]
MAVRRIADIERDVPERCNMLSGHVVEIKMMDVALREERMKRYSARVAKIKLIETDLHEEKMKRDSFNVIMLHKFHADGSLSRYKAQLVANGSSQQIGIDFDDTFSLVVKPVTIRTVLSLALTKHWHVHHLDVNNAFLNGDLPETVYMHQPLGFVDPWYPHHVCHLQRSLYGLKQASRDWFHRFATYATRVGFSPCRCDSALFIYTS